MLSTMETKTNKAVQLLKDGRVKEALSLFHKFRLGFTKSESRTIQIAYESMTGHARFYQMLGIDTEYEQEKALDILRAKYL